MKKILLSLSLVAFTAISFMGCSQQQQWNHQQRKALREALKEYRKMVYLENLTDAEFQLFTDEVASMVESAYPVYTAFIAMPGAADTVDVVVTEVIVEQLNADPRNMRHLYPYRSLVAEGVLPAGLDYEQQHSFYRCFAGKVNATYPSLTSFVNAVVADTTSTSQIRQLESECANTLFGWVITEIDIMEVD